MIIRKAMSSDNGALCRMELLAPQGTSIRLAEHRHDFFFKASLFPGAALLVLENEKAGCLVSVMGVAPVNVRVGNEVIRAAYMFDWRANPEAPRGIDRGMLLLWRRVQEQAREWGAAFIFGHVKADNHRAIGIYDRQHTRTAGGQRFFTLPVYRRRAIHPGIQIETSLDAAREYSQMENAFANHDLWPVIAGSEILQPAYDRYLRAKVTFGPSSCKVWDLTSEYERVILGVPPVYRAIRPVTGALSHMIPLPRIPAPGDRLAVWTIFDLVVPPGQSPSPLLHAVNNLAIEKGIDYLIVGVDLAFADLAPKIHGALTFLDYRVFIHDLSGSIPVSAPTYHDVRYL